LISYGAGHASEIQIIKNQYVRNARFACCVLSHVPSRWPCMCHKPDYATCSIFRQLLLEPQLPPERQQEAQAAVRATMWPQREGPRHFRNLTQFIVGQRRAL